MIVQIPINFKPTQTLLVINALLKRNLTQDLRMRDFGPVMLYNWIDLPMRNLLQDISVSNSELSRTGHHKSEP